MTVIRNGIGQQKRRVGNRNVRRAHLLGKLRIMFPDPNKHFNLESTGWIRASIKNLIRKLHAS